jgi:hypothetical protein
MADWTARFMAAEGDTTLELIGDALCDKAGINFGLACGSPAMLGPGGK